LAQQLSFSEWCHTTDKLGPEFPYYCRFFGNSFDSAVVNLRSLDFVLRTEHLSEDVAKMSQAIGIKSVPFPHVNRAPAKREIIIDADAVRNTRKLDFELLQAVPGSFL
jgi:hypothetical protein